MKTYPVMKVQCPTCPFLKGGWTEVREFLSNRALSEASPICHSTGPGALVETSLKEEMICRGARLFQAEYFYLIGFISEPTLEAWDAKVASLAKP